MTWRSYTRVGALERARRERAHDLAIGGSTLVDATPAMYWPVAAPVPDCCFIDDDAEELCTRAKRRLLYADRCGQHHAFPFDEITTLVIAAAYTESIQRAESALEGR